MKKYSRRDFINHAAKGTAGLIVMPLTKKLHANQTGGPLNKSRVVVVEDENALNEDQLDQPVIQIMVDKGIQSLTGINDIGEAWKNLFPGITQNSVISIKINCIASQVTNGLCSHPDVTYSIANGLAGMQVEGNPFPENNIIIWDRWKSEIQNAGYYINAGSSGYKCISTDYTGVGYSSTNYDVNGQSEKLSKILTDMSDYLINLCVLKDHSIAGVTLSMKNHYGTCQYPGNLHDSNCDPYIAALNNLTPIKNKQVISICDAIAGVTSGGPSRAPQVYPKSLIMSKDTVACDTIGKQMLQDYGTSSYTLNKATYISTAAESPYNLGTNDPGQIELFNIENPSTGITDPEKIKQIPSDFRLFQNYPNPFNLSTTISYQLFKKSKVKIDVFDIHGRLVQNLINKNQAIGHYRMPWDARSSNGAPLPSGIYLAHFQISNYRQVYKMQLIK